MATGQSISTRGEESGISGLADQHAGFASVRPLLYLGKGDDALLQVLRATSAFPRTLCLAHLGRREEVTALLEELLLARPSLGSDEDETRTERDIMLLEAAVLVGHREAAGLLLRRFAGTEMRATGYIHNTCIARHMGAAAALLDRPDEARGYYQTAVNVCREMPFRPEEALTRLQLAELLLDYYPDEWADALEHLDTAIAGFRDMKMQPYLERAGALKERAQTGPVRAPAYPDGLTQREVEVLRAVASGKSNPEVAEELFITINTVARHLTNIFGKIGATNRVEAANYAARQGLI